MYMLSASKEHAILEIIPFKGRLNDNDTKKVQEGKVIKFNRYHIAGKRKVLEELADTMKDQWIEETKAKIEEYKSLKVKIR